MSLIFDQIFHFFFRKCNASSLAVTRMVVGSLLLIDIIFERGLSRAETIWGDPNECRFPLFDSLSILPLRAMFAVYALMFCGNVGIILGLYYNWSCIIYLCCYWYLLLLDKSRWNNHSYLFGLLVLLLLVSNANYKWSLDCKRWSKTTRPRKVPFWQYFLIRSQIFLVYFFAGLKKIDSDWLLGYSMNISEHWVFSPFRILLTNEGIDYYVVHLGGFLFDLTIGFFLVYDRSRPIAFIFCALFNLMNSRIFSIGMFPYVMIGVMPVFSANDWPKQLIHRFYSLIRKESDQRDQKVQNKKQEIEKEKIIAKKNMKEKITVLFVLMYLTIQIILPHSHWLTKGYNTWTNGLYGYSWDMMVHNWKHIHTTVTVVDKYNRKFYLNPQSWTKSWRWSHHSDMVKQYAVCAHKRLTDQFNITEPSIYIDSWISMNGRFTQRVYDPRVDIVSAEWTPFKKPKWVLPILSHLADWRPKIKTIEQSVYEENEDNSVIFIADFPGLSLYNYIGPNFHNSTLTVLKGCVELHIEGLSAKIMSVGDTVSLPSQRFHKLTAIKSEAAAYVLVFANNNLLFNGVQNQSSPHKGLETVYLNPWITGFENIFEGFKQLLEMTIEMVLTLFKRLFICLNMCLL